MTLRIRPARPDELDEAARVMLAAYQQYEASFPTGRWERYAADILDVRGRLPHAELIVAEEAGRIVGAVTLYPDGSRSGMEGWPPEWAGVRLLAVHPDARGRGVGEALMRECMERSRKRGVTTLGLHTTTVMAVARGMYERMGFVRAPEYDFHPAPGIVVMAYRMKL
ncbi:MAG: GNAT family N-acetyltransferase [Dehalococcoidia bacterium]|nr:GNAT family N-acetyltransferase [Dehalococcoidia bacterium]